MPHNGILELVNTKNLGAFSYKAEFLMSRKMRKRAISSTSGG